MGLGSYFKASGSKDNAPATNASSNNSNRNHNSPPASEEPPSHAGNDMELQPPTPRYHSRPQSSRSGRSGHSTPSNQSSFMLDEIKHEVMVNYLYQQQCSQLWVSDGSGEIEGDRKSVV